MALAGLTSLLARLELDKVTAMEARASALIPTRSSAAMTSRRSSMFNGRDIRGEAVGRAICRSLARAFTREPKFERIGGHLPNSAAGHALDESPLTRPVEPQDIPRTDAPHRRVREGRWRPLSVGAHAVSRARVERLAGRFRLTMVDVRSGAGVGLPASRINRRQIHFL